MAKIRSFILTEDDQCYLEAFLLVLACRMAVLFCFAKVAPWALEAKNLGACEPDPQAEARVRMALESVANRVPWHADKLCLPHAIAGKVMLARRGLPSTVHLEVGKPLDGELFAHAWLEAGGSTVIGDHSLRATTRFRS